jgi:tetratricopeptide (TPR) repeat protein
MNKKELTHADETYVKNFLTGLLETDDADKGYSLLAQMYNHKAKSYHHKASEHAKKALELNPDVKMTHTALNESNQGFVADWNYHNHHDLIVYYQSFVKKNPNNRKGILFLLDQLIETYRYDESEVLIQQLKTIDNGYIIDLYKGMIEKQKGNFDEAMNSFDKMVSEEPNNWHVYASRADQYASIGMYQKAIEDNLKAYETQPSPKYIDAFECNAHIYEIMNQPKQAIEMYEQAIITLKSEWQITFGEIIDSLNRKIQVLKSAVEA